MTYTYTAPTAGAFAVPSSEVRFLLGDTAPAAPDSLTDEELAYLLAQTLDSTGAANTRQAAAEAALRMAARFDAKSHITSKSVDGLSISTQWANRADAMRKLSKALTMEAKPGDAPSIIWTGDQYGLDPFCQGQWDNGGGYGDVGWTEALWR